MADLPDLPFLVVLYVILPRLPPKVVTQCKVVCKQWLSFLSSPEFLRLHCYSMRTSVDQKIITAGPRSCIVRSLDCESPNFNLPTNVHIPFNCQPYNLLFISSLDGMLCVCLKKTCELAVWNPLTRVYRKLSNSNGQGFYDLEYDSLGICIDSSYDYIIVHIKRIHSILTIWIYSMRQNSWSTIRCLEDTVYLGHTSTWSPGTLCGNSLYFTVCQGCRSGNETLLRFDVDSRMFSVIGFPNVCGQRVLGNLVNIRDQLHLILHSGFYNLHVELWKLQTETWMKVFVYPHAVHKPVSLVSTIKYVNATGNCIEVDLMSGAVGQIDLSMNEITGFSNLPLYESLSTVIYYETIVSPDL
ncbi:putative F-box associated interaction domain, F-box-like domain superfamily [Helianthus debilis subsp. tardiflorus]